MSSEQVAFRIYRELDRPARAVVDAWRALGCGYVDALLNARTLSRSAVPVRPPADPWTPRHAPRSLEMTRRLAAEHEAAHATVAAVLGVPVAQVTIDDHGGGLTLFEAASHMDTATITVAAEVWINEVRWRQFPGGDRGCSGDRRHLARHVDAFGAREASTRARAILHDNGDAVLALADRLIAAAVRLRSADRRPHVARPQRPR